MVTKIVASIGYLAKAFEWKEDSNYYHQEMDFYSEGEKKVKD